MSSNFLDDISTLFPQIPTSIDTPAGLLRALENGTKEVQHLLQNGCDLIFECRCCKSMFRRAEYFHKHKLSVCRAYHRPIAPTYEEVLAFQRERDSSWDSQQPSASSEQVHEYKECNRIIEFVENESGFVDPYEGIEELCGETRTNSPEPGELLDDPGSPSSTNEGLSNNDDVEDGEYIEWLPTVDDSTSTKSQGESDTISLRESPVLPNGQLNFPIFKDQLLESPTHMDYYGKDDKILSNPINSTIQSE